MGRSGAGGKWCGQRGVGDGRVAKGGWGTGMRDKEDRDTGGEDWEMARSGWGSAGMGGTF